MTDYYSESTDDLPLFDYGQHARATRRDAYLAAMPRQSARQLAALRSLADAGDFGRTRNELADDIGVPIQSVCSVALALLRDQLAVETDQRRLTPTGSKAAVLVITRAGRLLLGGAA